MPKTQVAEEFCRTVKGWGDDESQLLSTARTLYPPSTARSEEGRAGIAMRMPRLELYEAGQPAPAGGTTALEINNQIAVGGMGLIHSATQRALEREVAIKRIKPNQLSPGSARKALVREAMLLGKLEHPNILPVHMLGRDENGEPVLVMKRIRGAEWRAMLHDVDHPGWANVSGDRFVWGAKVLVQVCNAVDYAHNQGVVHRDIKTANVMIGGFGEVYLLDWGVAVELDASGEFFEHHYAGTPVYSAPEMFDHRLPITRQTDVYLLGAVLHELLTGRPLHDRAQPIQVVVAALESEPAEYGEDVPEELAEIVHKATAAAPENRFVHVRAFRDALESYLQHRSAITLVHSAEALLVELEAAVQGVEATDGQQDNWADKEVVHELGVRTRFAFEQAIAAWPEREKSHLEQARCIKVLFQLAIAEEDTTTAELLEHELRQHASVALSDNETFVGQLAKLRERKSGRSDELSTQIQYTLVERLSRAESELRKLSALPDDAKAGESDANDG